MNPARAGRPRRPQALAVALAAAFALACADDTTITGLHGVAWYAYHGGRARLGWIDAEPQLSPDRVRASFGPAWESPELDAAEVDGTSYAAHLYASPLYLDDVAISAPAYGGLRASVVFAATSNGWVYALNASPVRGPSDTIAPGTILWKTSLGAPSLPQRNADGVPFGVLSTPFVDANATPPRMYVTCADAQAGWRAFALDVGSGAVLPGWPVVLDAQSVERVNGNPPRSPTDHATFADFRTLSQRAALNVSPAGDTLYVSFGSYFDGAIGWMVAIDTASPRVVASFSGAPTDVASGSSGDGGDGDANLASAGMWGAGGAAIDAQGRLFTTTGNSPEESGPAPGVWGNSVLAFRAPLVFERTYSPFNYCLMDRGDTDLGGSSPAIFELDPSRTSTPHLMTFGGKQGDVYLVDRDALAGSTDRRPPCDANAPPSPATDTSLLPPDALPYYAPPSRGPLNVFGPYSDAPLDNQVNNAKMRTAPAVMRDAAGETYVFVSGNSRDTHDITKLVPPSVVRLKVIAAPGRPAYLAVDAAAPEVVLLNPGSPVVSSAGGAGAIVWVLDENASRTDPLVPRSGSAPPQAVLYAFDASGAGTMPLLWKSGPIGTGGKYNHATIAHGAVIVGTDRVRAFAVR